MINTWWFNIIIYLVLYVIFTQFYKKTTIKSENDGALTILLQVLGGLSILILMPFFEIRFPEKIETYIFLGIACVLYAFADRLNTTARRGLEVSTYSILNQLNTVFIIILGITIFKEKIILNKLLGGIVIILANILVIYQNGKFEFNKYVVISIFGNLFLAIASFTDIGISDRFNLPVYIAITLIVPSILIKIFERVRIKDIISEFKHGDKKSIIIVGISWGILILAMLRAYQFGSVTTVAPICATTTLLNVFAAYFVQNEKKDLPKKIFAALVVVVGIIFIQI